MLAAAIFAAAVFFALSVASAVAVAPTISSTGASAVTTKSAVLQAAINPEGEATTYRFEYGTADCSSNPCTTIPSPDGNVGSGGSTVVVQQEITGLAPATTYHFRAIATNASGPSASPDRTFKTFAIQSPNTECPNQDRRIGPSASLPDCRAYEMVSPIDKNGGDITTLTGPLGFRASLNKSSLDGNKVTYSAYKAFGDAVAGTYVLQYMATRSADGWSTHSISPPRKTGFGDLYTNQLDIAFRDFTEDLSTAWLFDASETPLLPDALKDSYNVYRRDNLTGTYTTLTVDELGTEPKLIGDTPQMQGHTADGRDAFFVALSPLTSDAPAGEYWRLYGSYGGKLHLVSILPDGTALQQHAWAGSKKQSITFAQHGQQSLEHAISDDGSRVYWSDGFHFDLYLRENPAQPESARLLGAATGTGDVSSGSNEVLNVTTSTGSFQVGQEISSPENQIPAGTTITSVGPGSLTLSANAANTQTGLALSATSPCTEPGKACTTRIAKAADFWTATADGAQMLYSSTELPGGGFGALKRFDAETGASTQIAGEFLGLAGTSKDLSRIYFVSREDLAAGATAGAPNLYLDENGTMTLVATLAENDFKSPTGYKMLGLDARDRSTRVTPDGHGLAFQSTQPLTGYDNTASNNGEPALETYVYDADTAQLACASCNPSGARPFAAPLQEPFVGRGGNDINPYSSGAQRVWTAAWLTTAGSALSIPRPFSDDGNRLFFNSFDALVPKDTNGAQDVYEWEAQGSGDCQQAGGCINLISTGESPKKSEFIDASADGSDVFIETTSSIAPGDEGLIDIYDAREQGGFPPPPAPPTPCLGDACQSVPPAPNDPTPASAGFHGAGDPLARKKARRSCRARHAGKAKKGKPAHKKAKRCKRSKRRAGR